jgi:hypothetical protein
VKLMHQDLLRRLGVGGVIAINSLSDTRLEELRMQAPSFRPQFQLATLMDAVILEG